MTGRLDLYRTKTIKSRLVIKRFEEDQSQLRTFSPTVAREMVVLWDQQKQISRQKQSLKMRTAVDGLADTSQQWFFTAKRILVDELGLSEKKIEQAVFYSLDRDGQLDGVILMNVSDFL